MSAMGQAVAATHKVLARPAIHCIDYSDPGGGKSTFISTFPKPLLVIVFDQPGKETPYLRYPWPYASSAGRQILQDRDALGTARTWNTNPADPRDFICIEFYNQLDPFGQTGTPAYDRFTTRLWQSHFVAEGWATVALDSVTFMALLARKYAQYVTNPRSKDPRQWFGAATDSLEEALMIRLGAIATNFVIACHVDEDKDESNGMMVRNPSAPGRLRKTLPAAFGEYYRGFKARDPGGGEQFLLQTRGDMIFNASTQISAPNPCWAHYESLWANYDT